MYKSSAVAEAGKQVSTGRTTRPSGAVGAAVGALGISYGVVTRMMHLDWHTDGVALAAAVGLSIGLTALVGVLANTRALRVRPAEVLRGE